MQYESDNSSCWSAFQYVLFFDQGVIAFLIYPEEITSMSVIAVRGYTKTKNAPKTKVAIQKAENVLKQAGLPDVQDIHTECPTNPAATVIYQVRKVKKTMLTFHTKKNSVLYLILICI